MRYCVCVAWGWRCCSTSMESGDEAAEPSPYLPTPSERLCVQSGCHPQNPPKLQTTSPHHCLSRSPPRSLPPPSQIRDWSPPPPSVGSLGSTPPRAPKCGSDDCLAFDRSPYRLHTAVWLANRQCIEELLEKAADINEVDGHGATPLMLAVELLPRAREYERILDYLLESGADPRMRSSLGWSPLDEAVSRGDEELVRTLFASTQRNLRQRWRSRLDSITQSLLMLPDFECKIRWEFESPVVPLLNKIAPSDVVWLRKQGTSLRVDSTLASWKRFRRSKRRDLTTLFRGGRARAPGCNASGGDDGAGPSLCLLNHGKQTVVDVTEAFDREETSAVVNDLISADVMQWDMQVDALEFTEATTWLGAAVGLAEVSGWKALRFDVRGTFGVTVRQKGSRRNCQTFQEYFGCPLPPDACLPELREGFSRDFAVPTSPIRQPSLSSRSETSGGAGKADFLQHGDIIPDIDTMSTASEVLSQWPDTCASTIRECDNRDCNRPQPHGARRGAPPQDSREAPKAANAVPDAVAVGHKGGCASKPHASDRVGKSSHRVSASVWLATDFAIPMQQFLPIFEALSIEHDAMRRLKDVLSSHSLRGAAERAKEASVASEKSGASGLAGGGGGGGHVFPVRASVPLNLALRAQVHFEAFELRPAGSFPAELFEIPAGYRHAPRHEVQKTTSRAKKRMLLANLAL